MERRYQWCGIALANSVKASSSGAALELVNIRKEFPGFTAIEDLDLKINAGEFFALLGPSGCGKTTTLRIVAGLETPTSGRVFLGGEDITDTKPHQRAVNTVFQSYALFPHMTVLDNVAFGLRQRKVDEPLKKAQDALALFELSHLADRRPQQLSGGQQQRVALARAIVNRPSLLLLDEPLGALDLKLRRQMQIELKAIEQMGAPEALYDRPKTAFVSKFLGQSNLFVGDVVETNDGAVSINLHGNKITVPVARAEKTAGKIAVGVRPEKVQFHESAPAAAAGQNILGPGEIIDIRFTGVSNQYLIEIPQVGSVTVFAQNVGKSPVVELGAQVWVSFKVEHAFGLADLPVGTEED